MATKRDYYDILGVSRDATEDELKQAYRRLARQYHPDVNKSEDASERFNELSEAYDVLADPERRKAYDQFGHAGARAGATQGAGRSAHVDFGDLGSIFSEMFGGGRGPFGQGGSPFGHTETATAPRRGNDLRHEIHISFLTAVRGGRESIRFTPPGGGPPETLDLTIPPGIEDGAKLRLRGRGQPGMYGGTPGDLIVTVHIGRHPTFRREGLNLLMDVPLSIAEAVEGATVSITLADGESVDLKIPPGTSSGTRLRLKGRGIVDPKKEAGDLLVNVQIVAPGSLSDRGRELVRELAKELQNPRQTGG